MVASTRRRSEPAPVARTPEEERDYEAALVIQGQYRRRIGETLEIVNAAGAVETVRIQNINAGDDHAEVIVVHANKRIETIPAVTLAKQETLAAERAATTTGGASRVIRLGNAAEVTDIAGSTKKKFKMRYGAVDVSEAVEERARDAAEETLHREKAEVAGISGFIAKIWKHNVAYEIYRQVGIARARNKILTDKNLYTNEGLQKADHQRAVAAVVDRFVEEHQNSLHQQGADGERKEKLKTSPAEVAVKAKLNDLVREFATNPAMDEDELEKRKLSIFKEASAFAGEAKGRGVMVADNMIEIAKAVREHALHAGGIDNLDIDLEFVIGKAKMGARTEQEKSAIDKALEGMDRLTSKHGITAGIWGATRSGAAVAGAIGLTMAQMVAKSNIAKIATFGGSALATGLFSWWREKGRTNREHALHERQRALGGALRSEQSPEELTAEEIQLNRQLAATKWWQPVDRANLRARIDKVRDTKQPRREKMDEFAMHRLNARDLSDRGLAFLTPDGQLRPGLDPADAMRALADMEARVSIGNIEKKDLLQYSGVAEVEIERRDLDETRMVLKAALRAANANFETDYHSIYEGVVGVITDHKDTQQKKFDEYAKKRAKNAALIAVGSGLVVGFGAHEIWAWATGNETVTESFGNAGRWLMNYLNLTPTVPPLPTGAPEIHAFVDGAVNTPPGTELLQQADGSWSLQSIAGHHVIANGLHIGSNGSLDAASVHTLENLGGTVAQQDVMTDHVTTVTEETGVWDWIHSHAPDVTHIHRDIWMGNDTPMHFSAELQKWLGADFNELKLDWGKMGGVSPDGKSFVMDMSKMTSGGSWNGAMRTDAPAELLQGKIRLVLSMSESSQNHAVEIVVDQNGQAVIPMDSDIGRTFFTMHDGHAVFTGKYAEIAVSKGFDAQGTDHLTILATHTGKGLDHGITTRDIGECVEKHLTEIRLPSGATDPNAFPPIIFPPILPIRARTPMERIATRKPGPRGRFVGGDDPIIPPSVPGPDVVPPLVEGGAIEVPVVAGMYGSYESPAERKDMRTIFTERLSPTLRENPSAVLDFDREFAWYRRNRIDALSDYSADLEGILRQPDMVEPMSDECRFAPCIPVYALGEGKGMEHTLDQYRKQIDQGTVKPEEFELILFLNYPKDRLDALVASLVSEGKTMDGAVERVRKGVPEAYDTEEVIRQYKQKHPEMKIRVMKKEFPTRPLWGWIIKYAYDAACVRAAARKNPTHPDLLIGTNDADLRDMSDRYSRIIIDKFDTNERQAVGGKSARLDALSGRGDHDNEAYKRWPNFFLSTRFEQFLAAQTRFGYKGATAPRIDGYGNYLSGSPTFADRYVGTQGRNSILRASTYCGIGGARNERDAGADTELGDMILNARRGSDEKLTNERFPMEYVNAAWIETDPRRELGTYKKGQAIADTWNDWDKMDVYGRSFAEVIRGDKEELSVDRLQMEMFEFMKRWHGQSPYSATVQKALEWLGLSGVERNDAGEAIDAAGNVITDGDPKKFVRYQDYEVGEIEIPNTDGTKRKEWGIKILRLDHLKKNLAAWKPKRERVNAAAARRAAKPVTA